MKISVNNNTPNHKKFIDMRTGDIGTIVSSPYQGEIVLKMFESVVSLSDPKHIWEDVGNLSVNLFPAGTKITLEVE